MMFRILKWFPSAIFFAIVLFAVVLAGQNSSISSIFLVLASCLYIAASVKQSKVAIAFSWFTLATDASFALASRVDGLFLASLIITLTLSSSLAELSVKSLLSSVAILTDRQVKEFEGIAKSIIFASFLSGVTSILASSAGLLMARSLNLPNPIIGVLLFGLIIFGVVLLVLSESLSRSLSFTSQN